MADIKSLFDKVKKLIEDNFYPNSRFKNLILSF